VSNAAEKIDNPFQAPAAASQAQGAAANAVAVREVAEVQAAMTIAQKFPRDEKAAMDRILTACTRLSLADSAVYQYSRGGSDVTGPSIRLAEELARGWGNIVCGVTELTRSNGVSECMAYAWDLQTNFRDEKRFQVRHWRDTKSGGYAVRDERDIYEIIANQGSRRKRACVLAVIPGDVVEAAVKQCEVTLKAKADVTPEALAKLVERFGEFGVTKEQVEKRMQRRLDSMTPALMVNFRKIYNSLKDGMSRPEDWFEMAPADQETGKPTTGTAAAKAKLGAKAAPKPAAEPQIPHFDEATAIEALRSAGDVAGLKRAWDDIRADFAGTGRELPLAVEEAYNLAFEALAEKPKK